MTRGWKGYKAIDAWNNVTPARRAIVKAVILSHFNTVSGPVIFHQVSDEPDTDVGRIPQLMNLYKQGFFIHEFQDMKTANNSFLLPSSYARGGNEILMISIAVRGSELDNALARRTLDGFTRAIKEVPSAYKGFHVGSSRVAGDEKARDAVRGLVHGLYDAFPAEITTFKPRYASLFMFGLSKAGKTTIIQALQNRVYKENPPTISIDVSKIPMENVSFMVYDAPGQARYREFWYPHLQGQDALVFVVDVADLEKADEARDVLHAVTSNEATAGLPLLVLLHKIDLRKPQPSKVLERLDITKTGKRVVHHVQTSAVSGEGLVEAFTWLGGSLQKDR